VPVEHARLFAALSGEWARENYWYSGDNHALSARVQRLLSLVSVLPKQNTGRQNVLLRMAVCRRTTDIYALKPPTRGLSFSAGPNGRFASQNS
jgi:hypothetical protein